MPLIDQFPSLDRVELTGVVNKIRRPATFLQNTIYGRNEVIRSTEEFELGRESDGRETLPFVLPGAAALVVGSRTRTAERIACPNIRVKTALNPSEVFEARDLDESSFGPMSSADMNRKMQAHVARIQAKQLRDLSNTIEWMSSRALQGSMSYEQVGGDAFTIDFGRPAGHMVTLTGASTWDQSTAFPEGDFRTAKKLVSNEEGLGVTDCIMGEEAASAFLQNESVRIRLDGDRFEIGSLDLTRPFIEDGSVNFLGRFMGVRCWEYVRKINVAGVTTDMIRPKYAEFVSLSADNGAELNYGAVKDDFDFVRGQGYNSRVLSGGGLRRGRVFAKSWQTDDPTSLWILMQSRPMPFNRRQGWSVSMQVVPS